MCIGCGRVRMALSEAGYPRAATRVRHDEESNIGPIVMVVYNGVSPRLTPDEIRAFDKAIILAAGAAA